MHIHVSKHTSVPLSYYPTETVRKVFLLLYNIMYDYYITLYIIII